MSKYPKQAEVDKALKVVELQKEKERRMLEVKKEIGEKLEYFIAFNFKVDKKNKTVVFAGTTSELNVKIGVARCQSNDVFNSDIGKLIAVRRALNVATDDLMDLVESIDKKQLFITTSSPIKSSFFRNLSC